MRREGFGRQRKRIQEIRIRRYQIENKCLLCGEGSPRISSFLGVCYRCIRNDFESCFPYIEEAHRESRRRDGLPDVSPQDPDGLSCDLCHNRCRAAQGQRGYCGLRVNREGKWDGPTAQLGNLSFYHDPLPTNCVGDWVCPGGTGRGHPTFSVSSGPEYGHKNLAVFYHGCSFNCLFCQNFQFRSRVSKPSWVSAEALADQADSKTTCICYFGGDPTPQMPHAIRTSRMALQKAEGRIMRICWETNGSINPSLLDEMIELSMISGGCLKFDLKAWDKGLHRALCGVSNEQTLRNFERAAKRIQERPEPPLLIASTLLVPGYVNEEEVASIARFVAGLNPEIPYSLLAFYPHFHMGDLQTTSKDQAERCHERAKEAGLRRVRLGNVHLLSDT